MMGMITKEGELRMKKIKKIQTVQVICLFSCIFIYSTLSIAATADIYEDDDTWQSAKTILPQFFEMPPEFSEPQIHNFHDVADEDWVKFYAKKNDKLYTMELIFTNDNCTKCNAVIELYNNPEDKYIESFDYYVSGDGKEFAEWLCDSDGYYYARIKQNKPEIYGDETEYTLKMYIPTSPDDGTLYGKVTPSVKGAVVGTDGEPEIEIDYIKGSYQMRHQIGSFALYAEAPGYLRFEQPFSIEKRGDEVRVDIEFKEETEPIASIISTLGDKVIFKGDSLNFQGNVTGGKESFLYWWDFQGASDNSSIKNPGDVTFETPGKYTITFRVTDSDGNVSSTSITVRVTEKTCDINGDGETDLDDVVSVLKIVAGINTTQADYNISAIDKNGDDRIGTEEAVYIMQRLSELRD